MELSLSGNALKTFRRSITCLARVGHEVAIQASPSQIVFHTLNSSRSAYQSATFKPDFFDGYTVSADSVQFSVLLKAVCAVLRTPVSSVDLLSVVLPGSDASKVQWILQCGDGMKKSYWTNCNVELEIQHLTLDRQRFPSSFTIRPQDFRRLLSIFRSSLQEITVIANELNSVHSNAAKNIGGKAVGLRSYVDPTKENNESDLHTQLWIDPMEEFLEYKHSAGSVDVTFAMKTPKTRMRVIFVLSQHHRCLSGCGLCRVSILLAYIRTCEIAIKRVLEAARFGEEEIKSVSSPDEPLVLINMRRSVINTRGNLQQSFDLSLVCVGVKVDARVLRAMTTPNSNDCIILGLSRTSLLPLKWFGPGRRSNGPVQPSVKRNPPRPHFRSSLHVLLRRIGFNRRVRVLGSIFPRFDSYLIHTRFISLC
ncbi:hypothetical protein Sjap_007507 [Stephania japonica]|uniref:Checkpoint protein n=1 Tax=Stephania japonica TaxID=461633 RepID=A0AAP0PA21_9MAGN